MTFIPVGPFGDTDERFGVAPEALNALPNTISMLEEFEQLLYGDDGCDHRGYLKESPWDGMFRKGRPDRAKNPIQVRPARSLDTDRGKPVHTSGSLLLQQGAYKATEGVSGQRNKESVHD